MGFPDGSDGKESVYSAGDPGLIPGSGRSPGEGHSNPLQYSYLENPMDGGAWQAIVHGVEKSWTRLSHLTSLHFTSLHFTTEEGQKIVLQNGAHEVFNHKEANNIDKTKKSVGEKKVDVIIEMFANVKLSEDLNFLSHGGRVIVVGHRGPIEINPQDP